MSRKAAKAQRRAHADNLPFSHWVTAIPCIALCVFAPLRDILSFHLHFLPHAVAEAKPEETAAA
jgi:hypothetical protein